MDKGTQARAGLGLLVAPLAVPFIFGISAAIRSHSWNEGVFPFGMVLVFGAPFYYFAACCLGFPLWMLLRRYKVESLPAFAAGGGLIGLALGLLLRFTPLAITCALAGSVSATVFWVFVSVGRSSSGPVR